MRCVLRLASLVLALAVSLTPAFAGPWARGDGNLFLSFGLAAQGSRQELMTTGSFTPRYDQSLYLEYGIGQRITLGLDLNFAESSQLGTGFVRYTFTQPEATWQIALDAGITQRTQDRLPDQTFARLGFSIGRGLPPGGDHWAVPIQHEGGWATVDAVGLLDIEGSGDAVWQVEATMGLTLQNGWRAAVAVKGEEWPGSDFLLTISPSVMIDLSPRNTLQIGARMGLDGTDDIGLTLNFWRSF